MYYFSHSRIHKGFTLIELLVVVSIIGILAGLIVVLLNTSRQRGRDSSRISQIRQLQTALAAYQDANGSYPTSLSSLTNYIPAVPSDPNGASYIYAQQGGGTSYHLGAVLEVYNDALQNDSDATTTSPQFGGATTDCISGSLDGNPTNERCFDGAPQ